MRLFLSILFAFSVFIGNTPKAEAVVGLALNHHTVKVVGGVMSVSGVGGFFGGMLLSSVVSATITLPIMIVSGPLAFAGLIVLDEKNASMDFAVLSPENASAIGASSDELAVYNSEVDELNAVKADIESRTTEEASNEEITGLWKEYVDSLSPQTLKVAGLVAKKIFAGN
ncbi:MAG: hypothetical protein ACJ76H_17195 [Bacteriovoracaceae bacterium]